MIARHPLATCPKCESNYEEDVQFCPEDGSQLIPEDALPPTDADMKEGDMVGEYKVLGLLGKGGFGTVYRGVHPLIGKRVAIKVLHRQLSSNRNMVSRFISEARAVNQIGHKNIIDIFAFGQLPDGRQYYIMELIDGVSLERYLRSRGRMSVSEAIPILRAVGRALDAAHGAGIAHRDLKPDNVVVCNDDGKPFPKLLDFGIAKLMGSGEGLTYKTQTGTPMGTPAYMSPEQCLGRNVDHRTDVYAFGVMTYQLLTGKLPFTGESFVEIVVKQTSHEPLSPSQICEDIPEPLSHAILWMLKKDPAERPQTLAAAVARLEEGASAMGLSVNTGVTRMPEQLAELNRPMGMHTPAPLTGAGNTSTPVAAGQMSMAPPSQFEEAKRGGGGKWIGLAAAVLLLGGGGAFVALRGGPGAQVAKQPEPAGPQAPRLVDPPAPVPAPVPVPANEPPAPAAPAAPATVVLTVTDAPPGTEVRDDTGTLLGQVPGKLTLPRGDTPLVLHFEHAGYDARVEKVAVGADGQLAIQMHHARPIKKSNAATTTPASPTTPAKPPEKPPAPANPLPDF
jgi:tRNA A-37 threonylcarbamoyl transferase component Bud32